MMAGMSATGRPKALLLLSEERTVLEDGKSNNDVASQLGKGTELGPAR